MKKICHIKKFEERSGYTDIRKTEFHTKTISRDKGQEDTNKYK